MRAGNGQATVLIVAALLLPTGCGSDAPSEPPSLPPPPPFGGTIFIAPDIITDSDPTLIHVGQGEIYLRDGILEETFVHEAAHTSLDAYHASAPGWLAARRSHPGVSRGDHRSNDTEPDRLLRRIDARHASHQLAQAGSPILLPAPRLRVCWEPEDR
jgi:hypothetical protein